MRPLIPLRHEKKSTQTATTASIPMEIVGPMRIISKEIDELVSVPLATFETPLWPSTHRGARVCTHAGGIRATVIDERMTRSIVLEGDSVEDVQSAYLALQTQTY
jgi:hydroxymethylglutaryl-CoA reductase (NADPH)